MSREKFENWAEVHFGNPCLNFLRTSFQVILRHYMILYHIIKVSLKLLCLSHSTHCCCCWAYIITIMTTNTLEFLGKLCIHNFKWYFIIALKFASKLLRLSHSTHCCCCCCWAYIIAIMTTNTLQFLGKLCIHYFKWYFIIALKFASKLFGLSHSTHCCCCWAYIIAIITTNTLQFWGKLCIHNFIWYIILALKFAFKQLSLWSGNGSAPQQQHCVNLGLNTAPNGLWRNS